MKNFKDSGKIPDMYGRMHELGWSGGHGKGNESKLEWEMMYEMHKTSIKYFKKLLYSGTVCFGCWIGAHNWTHSINTWIKNKATNNEESETQLQCKSNILLNWGE